MIFSLCSLAGDHEVEEVEVVLLERASAPLARFCKTVVLDNGCNGEIFLVDHLSYLSGNIVEESYWHSVDTSTGHC